MTLPSTIFMLCLQDFEKNNELTNYQGIPSTIVYLVQYINTYVLIQYLTYMQWLTLLTEPVFYSHILNRIYKCKRMIQWNISQSRIYFSSTKPKYSESKKFQNTVIKKNRHKLNWVYLKDLIYTFYQKHIINPSCVHYWIHKLDVVWCVCYLTWTFFCKTINSWMNYEN